MKGEIEGAVVIGKFLILVFSLVFLQLSSLANEHHSDLNQATSGPTKIENPGNKLTPSELGTLEAASQTDLDMTAPKYQNIHTECCKICTKGKPCGNSCISRNKSCHKGRGCAC